VRHKLIQVEGLHVGHLAEYLFIAHEDLARARDARTILEDELELTWVAGR
jgi:hypothetical protein